MLRTSHIRTRVPVLLLGLVVSLGLGACSSNPSDYTPPESCPEGQSRNTQGNCVSDTAT